MVTLLELVFYETWQKIAFITSPANATKNIIKRPSPERLEKQVSGNELSQFSTISIEKRFISCITNCIPEDSRLANKSNTKIKLNSPNNSCNATKTFISLPPHGSDLVIFFCVDQCHQNLWKSVNLLVFTNLFINL